MVSLKLEAVMRPGVPQVVSNGPADPNTVYETYEPTGERRVTLTFSARAWRWAKFCVWLLAKVVR